MEEERREEVVLLILYGKVNLVGDEAIQGAVDFGKWKCRALLCVDLHQTNWIWRFVMS